MFLLGKPKDPTVVEYALNFHVMPPIGTGWGYRNQCITSSHIHMPNSKGRWGGGAETSPNYSKYPQPCRRRCGAPALTPMCVSRASLSKLYGSIDGETCERWTFVLVVWRYWIEYIFFSSRIAHQFQVKVVSKKDELHRQIRADRWSYRTWVVVVMTETRLLRNPRRTVAGQSHNYNKLGVWNQSQHTCPSTVSALNIHTRIAAFSAFNNFIFCLGGPFCLCSLSTRIFWFGGSHKWNRSTWARAQPGVGQTRATRGYTATGRNCVHRV